MTPVNKSAEILVAADSGVLPIANLRNIENWRALVHQIVPVIVSALVTMNIVTGDMATAWVPFVFAIADNLLSVGNAADRVRRAIYAGVGVLQAGGLVTMLVTNVAPAYVPVAGRFWRSLVHSWRGSSPRRRRSSPRRHNPPLPRQE